MEGEIKAKRDKERRIARGMVRESGRRLQIEESRRIKGEELKCELALSEQQSTSFPQIAMNYQ